MPLVDEQVYPSQNERGPGRGAFPTGQATGGQQFTPQFRGAFGVDVGVTTHQVLQRRDRECPVLVRLGFFVDRGHGLVQGSASFTEGPHAYGRRPMRQEVQHRLLEHPGNPGLGTARLRHQTPRRAQSRTGNGLHPYRITRFTEIGKAEHGFGELLLLRLPQLLSGLPHPCPHRHLHLPLSCHVRTESSSVVTELSGKRANRCGTGITGPFGNSSGRYTQESPGYSPPRGPQGHFGSRTHRMDVRGHEYRWEGETVSDSVKPTAGARPASTGTPKTPT